MIPNPPPENASIEELLEWSKQQTAAVQAETKALDAETDRAASAIGVPTTVLIQVVNIIKNAGQ